jgi:NIPSNAP
MGDKLDHGLHQTSMNTQTCCPIVELRQYTLHAGMRDTLIELFDREFVESQEATGMVVIGQFRDMDNPDRFVWLRGFADMPARAQALQDFYGGPIWKTHRDAANATMIDSDNVLLLRPAHPKSGFDLAQGKRPPTGTTEIPKGLVVATIYYLKEGAVPKFMNFFERKLKPLLIDANVTVLGYFVTEKSANTFPALPVREGANVFVWFASFPDEAAYAEHISTVLNSPRWQNQVAKELTNIVKGDREVLRLSPTARSRLGGWSILMAR